MKPLRSGLALLGALTLAGCDIPTDAPKVEQRWIVPVENTSISVDELLPDGVSVTGDLFSVSVDPFTTEATLGELCSTCVNGTTGPSPSFSGTFSASRPFPSDVSAAVLESGAVSIAVHNGFSFDPTAGGGSFVITITDGPSGKMLGSTSISSGMAPGSTVTRGITLAGGSVGPNIMASTVVTSPGGQSTTVNTSQKLTVNVEVTSVQVSFATVAVANRSVDIDPVDMDVSDIDDTISDRIQSGGINLDITNPFGVAFTVNLVIAYPGGTLTRSVNVAGTAVSTTSITYTGDEFRSFLGKDGVTLRGTGSVSSAAGPITVRPGQQLIIDATVDLTLVIG